MARLVFVLGAGASAHTHAPLMSQFMARIRDLREHPEAQVHSASFALVWGAFQALKRVHANVSMDHQGNIENPFASFEMARILAKLGDLPSDDVARLPTAMREVIADTIDTAAPLHNWFVVY